MATSTGDGPGRHGVRDPRHRREVGAKPGFQRVLLRRRLVRTGHHQGGAALSLRRQGRTGREPHHPLRRPVCRRSRGDRRRRHAGPGQAPGLLRPLPRTLRDQRMCLCGMLAAEYNTLGEPMRDAIVKFFDQNQAGWRHCSTRVGRPGPSLRRTGRASGPDHHRRPGRSDAGGPALPAAPPSSMLSSTGSWSISHRSRTTEPVDGGPWTEAMSSVHSRAGIST